MLSYSPRRIKRQIESLDSEKLKAMITEWGASLVGFGDVSIGLVPEFRRIPNAIAIAVKNPVDGGTYKLDSMTAYSHQYDGVGRVLESIQKKIITQLKFQGFRTLAIPPDSARADESFCPGFIPCFPIRLQLQVLV